jgi:hypothetical protein
MNPQNQNSVPQEPPHPSQPVISGPISYSSQQQTITSNPSNKSPRKKIIIISVIFLLSSIVLTAGYMMWSKEPASTDSISPNSSTSNLATYTAPSELVNGSPEFSTNFYRGAVVQHLNGLVYLTSTSTDGTKSSIWIYKLKSEIPICDSGGTKFTVAIMGKGVPGCYRNDRIIYTAEIDHNGVKYQVNLVSQKPIEVDEAKTILSSVALK